VKFFRLLMIAALLSGLVAGYTYYRTTVRYQGFREQVFVDIPHGANTRFIGDLLARKGVVRNPWDFIAARAIQQVVGRNATLQAGEYQFTKGASPNEVLGRIARGDIFFFRLIVPEGYNMFDMAAAIKKLGTFSDAAFLKEARNPALIKDLDPEAPSLEGYLFPDTYHLSRTTTPHQLVMTMTDRFRTTWNSLNGKEVHKTVTLASLVEREARRPEERPMIASVFDNRLDMGMKLDCDPTTVYAALLAGDYRGKIYRSDLERDSPWNTYRSPGLPPGPIANPGLSSLKAALHPESSQYLYFVAKGDGSGGHTFSQTLAQHQEATQVLRRAEKQSSQN
jgi:UPF0755 protein